MAKLNSRASIARFYQSLPLPSGSRYIRVLKLAASNPGIPDGGPLYGDLEVTDFDATPPPVFSALSYVCGNIQDACPTSTITLGADHLSLQLTDNCHNALKHLRIVVRPLTIWVDAISIHQEDAAEKTHQIALMGDVYAQAQNTFIWLGPGDQASGRAMQCLASIGLVEYFLASTPDMAEPATRPRPWRAACARYLRRLKHSVYRVWSFVADNDPLTKGKSY